MNIKDMQLICDMIAEKNVIVKRNNRWTSSIARVKDKNRSITIAEFIFNYPEEIQLAEIIHESIHHLSYSILEHGNLFKTLETNWLKQFGLEPRGYKRAYYTHIKTLDGRLVPTRNQYDAKPYKHYLPKKIAASRKRIKHTYIQL